MIRLCNLDTVILMHAYINYEDAVPKRGKTDYDKAATAMAILMYYDKGNKENVA